MGFPLWCTDEERLMTQAMLDKFIELTCKHIEQDCELPKGTLTKMAVETMVDRELLEEQGD